MLTGIPESFVNSILRTQAEPDNVDAVIEKTLAQFRARGVTEFCWWTEPSTRPTDLGKRLLDHGLMYAEGGPGMAADLLALNEDLPAPTGLTIERVEDSEALRKWAYASIIGFGLPETSVDTW